MRQKDPLRALGEDERSVLEHLSRSRREPAAVVARATLQRQVEQARAHWEQALWHLGNRRFACEPDAQAALAQHLKKRPVWLAVQAHLVAHSKHDRAGRPRQDAMPNRTEWQITATSTVKAAAIEREVQRNASFLVATHVLDPEQVSDRELLDTDKGQHCVERGFSFLDGSAVSGVLRLGERA